MTPPADKPSTTQAREKARDMLLGQHGVGFTAQHTGLAEARVQAMAEALHKARRIPRVRP